MGRLTIPPAACARALVFFELCIALCMVLGGCTAASSAASSDVSPNASSGASGSVPSSTADGSRSTQEVTDSLGRTVSVPVECTRIAALDSFAGEALVMAGAGPLMVAAPSGVSSDVILREMYPQLVDVAAPMSGGTVNIESLWALAPEVVLVKSSLYYAKDEIEKLDKLGIPYLAIDYASIDEQVAALELIGSILPAEQAERMGKIVAAYRDGVARVEACAAQVPDAERVRVYHSINQAVMTDGASSIGADWITRTGAVNVSAGEAATAERGDYQATLEQVFVWDPDVVICNEATTADYLLSDSKWTGLRAVEQQRIYAIPIGATRWGQRGSVETWFAMMWLGKLVYPAQFSGIDLHAEVVDFYGGVLGVEVDDALYDQMMLGRDMRKRPTGDGAQ